MSILYNVTHSYNLGHSAGCNCKLISDEQNVMKGPSAYNSIWFSPHTPAVHNWECMSISSMHIIPKSTISYKILLLSTHTTSPVTTFSEKQWLDSQNNLLVHCKLKQSQFGGFLMLSLCYFLFCEVTVESQKALGSSIHPLPRDFVQATEPHVQNILSNLLQYYF